MPEKLQTKPLVGLGLPVYNGAKFVGEAIESILSQTFSDFELIISDNASTDSTPEICRRLAERDGRISYYRNSANIGASRNYNMVFELSSSKYFKWVSHDDICAPTYLERCVDVMEENSIDAAICYPKTLLIDEAGTDIGKYDDKMNIQIGRPVARLNHVFRSLNMCNAIFGLIRSRMLEATGLIGNYPASDVVLIAELSLHGVFVEVPEYLFYRRLHPERLIKGSASLRDIALWFDPARPDVPILPKCRFLYEYFRAIGRAPLAWHEKLDCCGVVVDKWLKKHWRGMGTECKDLLRYKLGTMRNLK